MAKTHWIDHCNKLKSREIKQNLFTNRINRIRIGHARLTHGYLMKNGECPICVGTLRVRCNLLTIIKCILTDCLHSIEDREKNTTYRQTFVCKTAGPAETPSKSFTCVSQAPSQPHHDKISYYSHNISHNINVLCTDSLLRPKLLVFNLKKKNPYYNVMYLLGRPQN